MLRIPESRLALVGYFLLAAWFAGPVTAEERVPIGRFSDGDLDNWKTREFDGLTRYRLTEEGGRTFLIAQSEDTAAAYYFEHRVDLRKTPVLNWSWRKDLVLDPGDENSKAGDDFVARVYVVRSGGLAFWNTRAINYVWSFQHARGDVWDNPFAGDRAKMVSLRDASDGQGQWLHERRHVIDDFRELLGMDIDHIDGVAIMTDSDNSGGRAVASYGDIWFSAR